MWPRILAERLEQPAEPLALLLRLGEEVAPASLVSGAARALLGGCNHPLVLPTWLAPHQLGAAQRLGAILERYGGALLADAVGLGKSYVALGVALARRERFALVVPAVLADQWGELLTRYDARAPVVTHETLSRSGARLLLSPPIRLFIVDEAHRFRNRSTRRYRALARLVVGASVLLVTATPVHNRLDDLLQLFQLFLRDDALTALGVPSLHRATHAAGDVELLRGAVARLTVARSRQRIRAGYPNKTLPITFPTRAPGRAIRAGPLPDGELDAVIAAITGLAHDAGSGALLRLLLLYRLGSSVAALGESVDRYAAYLEMAGAAGRSGRALSRGEFQRLFPERGTDALQLVLFPLLLAPGAALTPAADLVVLNRLRELLRGTADPKAARLEALIDMHPVKTIVFTDACATARYLVRRLAGRRVAAVFGDRGWLGGERATRREVLRAFAPVGQGAPPPVAALETDVLIATDLLSEGVNLQDAARVIHYDLPWSPARLAQRIGRVDRLASPHAAVESVTFLPPRPLATALRMEERLAAKVLVQITASAQVETADGSVGPGALDWCDRLDGLICTPTGAGPSGAWAVVSGTEAAVVLVLRLGEHVEAIVVDESGVRPDPAGATALFDRARETAQRPTAPAKALIETAIEQAAPFLRARLGAVADARWRAGDRDRLGRRLIPWVLTAARGAARQGDRARLGQLDALVSRLASGMTAGETLLLEELVEAATPLTVQDLLRWHDRLPPVDPAPGPPEAELVAALCVIPMGMAPQA